MFQRVRVKHIFYVFQWLLAYRIRLCGLRVHHDLVQT